MTAIIPIPAFADNYIWLLQESGVAAVVDPGDAAPALAYLERERLELAAIVNTHHHGDHVGGNRALLARRQVAVFGPAHETIPGVTRPRGGRHVLFAGHRAQPIDVPGHTASWPRCPPTLASSAATNIRWRTFASRRRSNRPMHCCGSVSPRRRPARRSKALIASRYSPRSAPGKTRFESFTGRLDA
jgi:hypothetical protein